MLEPQSTMLFIALAVIFGVLMWWMLATRWLAVRIVAPCLAFVLAMVFGVMAVNRYYGYYDTWGAAIVDLTGQGVSAPSQVPYRDLASGSRLDATDRSAVYLKLAKQQGYTVRMTLTGQLSHITRTVYVYLPPEYFRSGYRRYRFPVIELITGQPGEPQDWINVVGVTVILDQLVTENRAQPAVLVMPDANGGENVSLQCLNQVHGPQDLTYLGMDVPTEIARIFRVQPPGLAWGIAGYSEGGFCAANMALRLPARYGAAGVLTGYFAPFANRLASSRGPVSPFGGNRSLERENTPLDEVRALRPGAAIPKFWLGAGAANKLDVTNAEYFWQELALHQAGVPLVITPGSGHTVTTWRAEVGLMLRWMTPGLAESARLAARHAQLAARHAQAAARHLPHRA